MFAVRWNKDWGDVGSPLQLRRLLVQAIIKNDAHQLDWSPELIQQELIRSQFRAKQREGRGAP